MEVSWVRSPHSADHFQANVTSACPLKASVDCRLLTSDSIEIHLHFFLYFSSLRWYLIFFLVEIGTVSTFDVLATQKLRHQHSWFTLQWRYNEHDGVSITSLTIVYSTVYSCADQRKHQNSASLAFVRGIHRWPVNSHHKGPVTRKMFPFDDVIMGI